MRINNLKMFACFCKVLLFCAILLKPVFCFSQADKVQLLQKLMDSPKIISTNSTLKSYLEGKATASVIVMLRTRANSQNQQNMRSLPSSGIKDSASFSGHDFQTMDGRRRLKNAVKVVQDEFLGKFDREKVHVTSRFAYLFGFAGEVTLEGLSELTQNDGVLSIEENTILYAQVAQGIPLMNGSAIRNLYDGSGLSIAICDSGIDTSHPMLGGGGFPNSKVIGGYDIADDDNDPRPDPILGSAHGTACAGIAAGNLGMVGYYIGGVAPGARIYALKVSAGNSNSTTIEYLINSWEWCITHQFDNSNHPIMIISASYSGSLGFSTCDALNPAMTQAAVNVMASGITLFCPSGNQGYCDLIGSPACISHIISVGAVYDASFGEIYPCVSPESCAPKHFDSSCSTNWYAVDNTAADMVASSSNTANFLDLLAPSFNAYTTDIVGYGGNSSGDYDPTFGGTSASCPYAAGSAAVLQSAAKALTGSFLTPTEIKNILIITGDATADGKVAIIKPRINLGRAVNALSSGPSTYIKAMPWIPLLLLDDGGSGPTCPVIPNGDFESGANIWTEYSTLDIDIITSYVPLTPHSGSYVGWLGGNPDETKYLQQQITVSSACPYLSFYHWLSSADVCGFDFGYVRINGANVATLNLCGTQNTNGWVEKRINLSSYAGQTAVLQFRAQTDGSLNSNWFIDDVSFQSTD